MPDAGLAVAVAGGDDGAVAGELADAVAHVVGDPDVAALIDGDAARPVAAGIAGEVPVGGDLGDGVCFAVANRRVVLGVDLDGDRKGQVGGVTVRTRQRLTCAGKQREVLVPVVDDPGRGVGVDSNRKRLGDTSCDIAGGAGGYLTA